jgi:hypothetical protein
MPNFTKISTGIQATLRFCLRKIEAVMLVLLIVEFINDDAEMRPGAMIYVPSSVKTD